MMLQKGIAMCGIAGIIKFNVPEVKQVLLARMVTLMHHRGLK